MSISERLRKTKKTDLENAGASVKVVPECPRCAKKLPWVRVRVGIQGAGECLTVCERVICAFCGKSKKDKTGKKVIFYTSDNEIYSFDYKNFNVPREMCEEPVFDSWGKPVLDKDNKQIYAYREGLKIKFVEKLLSLVNYNCASEQYFTLAQINAAQQPTE